jgi:hypothetical protein
MGSPNTDNIKPLAQLVAYEIALGLTYEEIAESRSIPLDHVLKLSRGNLVKKRVKEFQIELKDRLLEEKAHDPVVQFLHKKGMTFAKTIVEEAENRDEGATPATRLKAAQLGLQFGGRTNSETNNAPTVVVNISQNKLKKASEIQEEVLKAVPDYVD